MNPLVDLIPAKYRKYVYAIATAAALIFGVWQASNGDWTVFAASLVTALTTGLATSNTNVKP